MSDDRVYGGSYDGQTSLIFPNRNVGLAASSSSESYFGNEHVSGKSIWNPSPSFESHYPYGDTVPPPQPQYLAPPPHPPQAGSRYPFYSKPPMTPPAAGYLIAYPPYTYSAPYWPPPPPVVEYVTDIQSEDVLSGRGGATNSHRGNRAFRALVKKYQDQYLQAKKRDKPAVASIIVDLIRKKGGRFLRRWGTDAEGNVLWVDIGDERAREKTCQALREGAPELRRRKKALSSDEDDSKLSPSTDQTTSGESNLDSPLTDVVNSPPQRKDISRRVLLVRDPEETVPEPREANEGDIVICPLPRLMQGQSVDPIPLTHLSIEERNLYLQDFWPPNPSSGPNNMNTKVKV